MRIMTTFGVLFAFNALMAQYTDTIYVGFEKTAYLIFDGPVKCDKGSELIKITYPENKVIIQAYEEEFDEASLLVQCENEYFLFLVRYDANPKKLFYNYQKAVRSTFVDFNEPERQEKKVEKVPEVKTKNIMFDHALLEKNLIEQELMDSINKRFSVSCEEVLEKKQMIFNRGAILGKVTFQITNICQKEDQFYFKMRVTNKSKISYEMDYIGWVVRDVKRKIMKGVSDQPTQLLPIYIHGRQESISGKSSVEMVFVFEKFVLVKDKKLKVEAWEDNGGLNIEGGRKMDFSIFANDIMDIKEI